MGLKIDDAFDRYNELSNWASSNVKPCTLAGTAYSVSAVDAETIRRWELSKADPELALVIPTPI